MDNPRSWAAAISCGPLLALAFPWWDIWVLAGVCLVPLLWATEGRTPGEALLLGWAAGTGHFVVLLHWIVPTMRTYGGMPLVGGICVLVLLCLYLGGFWGVFCLSVRFIRTKTHIGLAGIAPALWCSLEGLRGVLLSGFPWEPLGNALWRVQPLIQLADVTGVWGLSFLALLFNVSLYEGLMALFQPQGGKRAAVVTLLVTCLLLGAALAYGQWRMDSVRAVDVSSKALKVGIAQGNIGQSLKWDPSYRKVTMDIYQDQTLRIARKGARLVVWPESAAPVYLPQELAWKDMLLDLSRSTKAHILFGTLALKKEGHTTKVFNRAYLIGPTSGLLGHYDKVHLVPFGEYVPLRRFLFFLKKLVEPIGDITPGKGFEPLETQQGVKIGVTICFESIFPAISRAFTQKGADILANITNDAWFGISPGPYQHLSHAVLRSVENRRWTIRAANTGISAFIDPTGTITSLVPLMKRKILVDTVRLVEIKSFYTIWGDWFVYLCAVWSFLLVVIAGYTAFRRKRYALTRMEGGASADKG